MFEEMVGGIIRVRHCIRVRMGRPSLIFSDIIGPYPPSNPYNLSNLSNLSKER
jgi:hypothetical protein